MENYYFCLSNKKYHKTGTRLEQLSVLEAKEHK